MEVVKHELGGRRQWGLSSSAPLPHPPTALKLQGVHLESRPTGRPLGTSLHRPVSRFCVGLCLGFSLHLLATVAGTDSG